MGHRFGFCWYLKVHWRLWGRVTSDRVCVRTNFICVFPEFFGAGDYRLHPSPSGEICGALRLLCSFDGFGHHPTQPSVFASSFDLRHPGMKEGSSGKNVLVRQR